MYIYLYTFANNAHKLFYTLKKKSFKDILQEL